VPTLRNLASGRHTHEMAERGCHRKALLEEWLVKDATEALREVREPASGRAGCRLRALVLVVAVSRKGG